MRQIKRVFFPQLISLSMTDRGFLFSFFSLPPSPLLSPNLSLSLFSFSPQDDSSSSTTKKTITTPQGTITVAGLQSVRTKKFISRPRVGTKARGEKKMSYSEMINMQTQCWKIFKNKIKSSPFFLGGKNGRALCVGLFFVFLFCFFVFCFLFFVFCFCFCFLFFFFYFILFYFILFIYLFLNFVVDFFFSWVSWKILSSTFLLLLFFSLFLTLLSNNKIIRNERLCTTFKFYTWASWSRGKN